MKVHEGAMMAALMGAGRAASVGGRGSKPRSTSSAQRAALKEVFQKMDEKHNKHVDFTEFLHACLDYETERYMDASATAAARELFDTIDKDGNGTIERREFTTALRKDAAAMKLAEQFPALGRWKDKARQLFRRTTFAD